MQRRGALRLLLLVLPTAALHTAPASAARAAKLVLSSEVPSSPAAASQPPRGARSSAARRAHATSALGRRLGYEGGEILPSSKGANS